MKNLLKYTYILFSAIACISCSIEEMTQPDSSSTNQVRFIARPTSFCGYDVVTKSAEALSQLDSKISTAFFLAFNNKGERFLFEDLTADIQGGIPSVNLRSDIRTTEVTVCWLANVSYDFAASIQSVEDLETKHLDIVYADPDSAGAIGVPVLKYKADSEEEYCFPMFCTGKFELSTIDASPVTMELKRLFARMDVELSLNLEGDDEDHKTKFFNLMEYSVINLPNKVMLIDPSEGIDTLATAVMEPSGWGSSDMAPMEVTDRLFEGDATFGQNEGVSFSFYAPEHFVIPSVSVDDVIPTSVKQEERQKYKPLLAQGQNATLLRFKGLYGEGSNEKTLTYDIYLGRNNSDDFCIFRNYRYNNKISIINTQNFKDGGDLGVDHRVDLKTKGFLVGFKRATLLDAHYEVRPMRIKFPNTQVKGKVTVEILKEDKTPASPNEMTWIRVERPKASDRKNSSTYCTTGKRKYFTTDLVTSDLEDGVKIEYNPFDSSEGDLDGHIPIWVYVDEYSVAATDNEANKNRKAIIRVTFTPDKITEENGIVSQSFTVQQRAMYPITYGGRTYNIEYFEEYLYDFDGQDNYGDEGGEYVGGDGVMWGMNDTQLSHIYTAKFVDGENDNFEDYINDLISEDIKYDYYLQRDIPSKVYNPITNDYTKFSTNPEIRDFSGYIFNFEIITDKGINNGSNLALDDQVKSAIEYCYKKNKADPGKKEALYVESTSGLVNKTTTYNTANLKWYVPAIDEMEDIIQGGKSNEFFNRIFTNDWYWSCQPAYNRYYMFYHAVGSGLIVDKLVNIGEYYVEDIKKSRATKLSGDGFIASDSEGYTGLSYRFENTSNFGLQPKIGSVELPNALDLYMWSYEGRLFNKKWVQKNKLATFDAERDAEGVFPRDIHKRVRCIYNPNPPKKIKVSGSGDNTKYEYVY